MFETWLETCFVPQLKPNQVVILDNATFHHGGRIAEIIEAAGCQVMYLPPYSPDFNRIEKCWAWLKSRVRKRLSQTASLRDADTFHVSRRQRGSSQRSGGLTLIAPLPQPKWL